MKNDINTMLQERLASVLVGHVEPIFKAGTLLTIIARTPGNDEADVLVTADNIDAVAALIERSRARKPVGGTLLKGN